MLMSASGRSRGGGFFQGPSAVVFYAAAGFGLIIYLVVFAPLPFVAAWWKSGTISWDDYSDPLHKRARMADGMKLGRALTGKTRAEVVAQLGEPPATTYFSEYQLVYELGRDRTLFGIDSEWLAIRMGVDGKVSEVDVLAD
ncbi:MAG: hypothetical protein QM773_02835 [Hyphomonadaceae bacterium]